MNDEERKQDYIKNGNDFRMWVLKAQELENVARFLEHSYREASTDIQKGVTGSASSPYIEFLSSLIFMYACTLELYLKALIASKGICLVDKEGRLNFKSHNLGSLASTYAKLVLSVEESELLELLKDFIETWGKYPIPLSFNNWRIPKQVFDDGLVCEGIQPLYIWSDRHLSTLKIILNEKIIPEIPEIKW